MRNRLGLWIFMPIAAGLAGCATTPGTGGGSPIFGPQAWSQSPAPPQRTVATTVPAADVLNPATQPTGLSKYFPGLQRASFERPQLLARYRPTWFGLRPDPAVAKPAQPTTYMTDARAGLSRPGTDLATLPVALQVPPSNRSTDTAVNPAAMRQSIGNVTPQADDSAPELPPSNTPAPASSDLGIKTPKSGAEEVNPLPPAIERENAPFMVASRMPEVPPVDPQDTPKPIERAPAPAPATAPPIEPAPTLTPAPPPPNPNPAPAAAPAPAASVSTPAPSPTGDDKAVQAIPPASNSGMAPGLPEPTVPASYASVAIASQSVGNFKKHFENKVHPSPQSAPRPTPQAMPRPQVKATPQVVPTSQSPVPTSLTKPSPQATASAQSCEEPAATAWKRPCLRRLVRKVCKLGEYADPPTAAPH